MHEILILTCPGERETDERYALVAIDVRAAKVQRVSEALSGDAIRALLEGRGEPSWCVAARMATARQQMADADCRPSELAAQIPRPRKRLAAGVGRATT